VPDSTSFVTVTFVGVVVGSYLIYTQRSRSTTEFPRSVELPYTPFLPLV